MAKKKKKKLKQKRTAQHPWVPPMKKRSDAPSLRSIQRANAAIRRERVKAIVARTAAGRAKIDAFIGATSIADLDGYPVVHYPTGIAPQPPGLHKLMSQMLESEDEEIAPPVLPERTPIAPPVPFDKHDEYVSQKPGRTNRCSRCSSTEHTVRRCPEPDIAAPEAPARVQRCSFCHQSDGHNARTCPEKMRQRQCAA